MIANLFVAAYLLEHIEHLFFDFLVSHRCHCRLLSINASRRSSLFGPLHAWHASRTARKARDLAREQRKAEKHRLHRHEPRYASKP